MIIIGEKINGAIPGVASAIRDRDEKAIIDLVVAQETAGADYLDVCAGTATDLEYEALTWLIGLVQSVAQKPLCLDSPDPRILEKVLPMVQKPGIINSISLEGDKCEIILPLLKGSQWQVIALACDKNGVAVSAEDKTRLAHELIARAAAYDVAPERIHIDPLVLALSAVNDSALHFFEAIKSIKKACPSVNITAALSNVSYGMPARKNVNCNFLALAIQAGINSVICNPLDKEMVGTIYATEAILGRDRLCRRYNQAYRAGKFGTKKLGKGESTVV